MPNIYETLQNKFIEIRFFNKKYKTKYFNEYIRLISRKIA